MRPVGERILLGAANILEKNRWLRKQYEDGKGGYCVREAMVEAARVVIPNWQISGLRFLADIAPHITTVWNDEPGRTKAEVVEALRKAAGGA